MHPTLKQDTNNRSKTSPITSITSITPIIPIKSPPDLHEAEKKAIEQITTIITNAATVQHQLVTIRNTIKQHRAILEQQCTTAKTTMFDQVQLAVMMVLQANTNTTALRTIFQHSNACCEVVKQLFPHENDVVDHVNTVRKNVEATIRLLDKFRTIPQQSEQMITDLDADDKNIKKVYIKLRKVIALRDGAIEEGGAGAGAGAGANANHFKEQLMQAFDELEQVCSRIEERVIENIQDLYTLAHDAPTVVVRTMEVVEIEDRARRKVIGKTALREGNNATTKWPTMRSKVFSTLEEVIAHEFSELHVTEADAKQAQLNELADRKERQRAEKEMKGELLDSDSDSEEDTNGKRDDDANRSDYILKVLQDLETRVIELFDIVATAGPLFPPDYKIAALFESRYRHWLKVTLNFHCHDPTKLTRTAILTTIQWILWYQSRMMDFPARPEEDLEIKSLVRTLMLEYTQNVEATLMTMINRIALHDQYSTPELDQNGKYFTSTPSDLFFLVNEQLEIVLTQYKFIDRPLIYVVLMIASALTYYTNEVGKFMGVVHLKADGTPVFGDEQLEKHDHFFAAMVNNAQRCVSNWEDLRDRVVFRMNEVTPRNEEDKLRHEQLMEQLDNAFDEVTDNFVGVASDALNVLVLFVMTTLQKSTVELYGPEWLAEPGLTRDITSTLDDFFKDFRKWIQGDIYFAKIVRMCLHNVIVEYVRTFLSAKPLISSSLFARLRQDKEILTEFFNAYSEFLPTKAVSEELEIITLFEDVAKGDAEHLHEHFAKMIIHFGDEASQILDGVLSLRKRPW